MNMLMRSVCFLLSVCLSLPLLAGCQPRGGASSLDDASSAVSGASSTPSASPEETASASQSYAEASLKPESSAASQPEASADTSTASSAASASQTATEDGDWKLVLVSAAHPMVSHDNVETATVGGYQVDKRIAASLQQMLNDAGAVGLKLQIISGYRPVSTQERLYNNKVQEYLNSGYNKEQAAIEAAKWVAAPGTSEHNTGLAVDIVSANYFQYYSDLQDEFETFDEAKWMKANCAQYGFILRYPKGKESITGIHYEPWHFRYVGVEAAKAITSGGLTLEEYLQK